FQWSGSHVKETETWNFSLFEQALVNKLLSELLNLEPRHLAAIRRDGAVRFAPHRGQLGFRRREHERRQQLLFEHGEMQLEILEGQWRRQAFAASFCAR